MSTLTVGQNQEYSTISAAVAASHTGDTIDVQAGTYTNDFLTIDHSLTLQAVGGQVNMVATQAPPNGKAIIDEGGSGVGVTISGFALSGAQVADGNGAGIRYEGGNLTLNSVYIHDNQDGLLAASDPNGQIAINNSEFAYNGAGDGYTHNLYANQVNSLSIDNSYFHDASVGHEIKSRALNTTIQNSRILDLGSTASYSIDLPNGGNAQIRNNVIQQGNNSQNPIMISFGEEGSLNGASSLSITGNQILNEMTSPSATGIVNRTGVTATVSGNQTWGLTTAQLVHGPAATSGTTVLQSMPALDLSSPWQTAAAPVTAPTSSSTTTPTQTPTTSSTSPSTPTLDPSNPGLTATTPVAAPTTTSTTTPAQAPTTSSTSPSTPTLDPSNPGLTAATPVATPTSTSTQPPAPSSLSQSTPPLDLSNPWQTVSPPAAAPTTTAAEALALSNKLPSTIPLMPGA